MLHRPSPILFQDILMEGPTASEGIASSGILNY